MSFVRVLSHRARSWRRNPHGDPDVLAGRPCPIARWNTAMVALPALIMLIMGWHRRWISDDGLIFTRTVRQILAGHGPVFNVGERAESSTSTLWQWILVAGAWVTRVDVGRLAVYLGLLCTVAGYALALHATRWLYTPRHADEGAGAPLLLPLGVLALIALPPVWDFATSGLETGLTTLWLAACWWLLVRLPHDARPRTSYVLAFLAGLGPMVRPDLAIASIGFLAAIAFVRRPRAPRALALLGTAVAAPLAYEIFRMGYYGVLLPLPAVTKEASATDWPRGWGYVRDLVGPYHLWIPLAALAWFVIVHVALRLSGPDRIRLRELDGDTRDRITVYAVPALSGLAMLVYVMRVGGDFMHARMLLPGLFTLLLPILIVPARRLALPAGAVLIGWALICAIAFRVPYTGIGPRGIADERAFYVDALHVGNPVTAQAYIANYPRFPDAVRTATAEHARVIVYPWYDGFYVTPLTPDGHAPIATVWTNLGMNGAGTPLDGVSVDILGLAYPLAAHVELAGRGRPGHEKEINIEWVFAQYADPDAILPPGIDPIRVEAARYALTCGDRDRGILKELQDSVSKPMTWSRFWNNLTGAVERTSFRFPNDPVAAAKKVCGVDVLAPGVLPADTTES